RNGAPEEDSDAETSEKKQKSQQKKPVGGHGKQDKPKGQNADAGEERHKGRDVRDTGLKGSEGFVDRHLNTEECRQWAASEGAKCPYGVKCKYYHPSKPTVSDVRRILMNRQVEQSLMQGSSSDPVSSEQNIINDCCVLFNK